MGFPGIKTLGVDIASDSATPLHELGLHVSDNVGNVYVYVLVSTTVAAGDIIAFAAGYDVAALAGAGTAWAVAQNAITDEQYGFVQVKGVAATAAVVTDLDAGDHASRSCDGSGDLEQVDSDADSATGLANLFGVSLGTEASNYVSIYIF
jgi:hypothetical protein